MRDSCLLYHEVALARASGIEGGLNYVCIALVAASFVAPPRMCACSGDPPAQGVLAYGRLVLVNSLSMCPSILIHGE